MIMNIRNVKNILDTVGFVATLICLSATPQMVKWYFGLYVVYLISIWLSDENSTH